jgi:hypothetical protein
MISPFVLAQPANLAITMWVEKILHHIIKEHKRLRAHPFSRQRLIRSGARLQDLRKLDHRIRINQLPRF